MEQYRSCRDALEALLDWQDLAVPKNLCECCFGQDHPVAAYLYGGRTEFLCAECMGHGPQENES